MSTAAVPTLPPPPPSAPQPSLSLPSRGWEVPPSLSENWFDLFGVAGSADGEQGSASTPSSSPFAVSLPLPLSLQQMGAVEEWKRTAAEGRKRARAEGGGGQGEAVILSCSHPTERSASSPPPPLPSLKQLRGHRLAGWTWWRDSGAAEEEERKVDSDCVRELQAELKEEQRQRPKQQRKRGREEAGRGAAHAEVERLQAEVSSLSPSVLLQRVAAWDELQPLQPTSMALRLLSSSSSTPPSAVSFVSRVSLSLLELDVAHSLFTSASSRAVSSFRANAALPSSAMFLSYADLSGRSERGAMTEFIQWRRRSCQLRARGWGIALPHPQLSRAGEAGGEGGADAGGGRMDASASPSSAAPPLWLLSSFNPLAREQSAKNFTAFPPSTSVAAFVEAVGRATDSKGVQLVLGAAPSAAHHHQTEQPLTSTAAERPPGHPPASASSSSSVMMADLLSAVCACFGVLQVEGSFCYRLCRTSHLLAHSPLLLSSLHLLSLTFDRLHLHRTLTRSWADDECWIIATRFRLGRAPRHLLTQPQPTSHQQQQQQQQTPTASGYHTALSDALRCCVETSESAAECEQWSLGTGWQADAAFLQHIGAAVRELQRRRVGELRRLCLRPISVAPSSDDAVGPFRSPSRAQRAEAIECLLSHVGLARVATPDAPR